MMAVIISGVINEHYEAVSIHRMLNEETWALTLKPA
jgi:hypothetical protein